LTSFWSGEAMGVAINPCCVRPPSQSGREKPLSPTARMEEAIIRQSAENVNKQWRIPYPLNPESNIQDIPCNYEKCVAKMYAQERRLRNNPELAQAYNEQIVDMVQGGCVKRLTGIEMESYKGPVH